MKYVIVDTDDIVQSHGESNCLPAWVKDGQRAVIVAEYPSYRGTVRRLTPEGVVIDTGVPIRPALTYGELRRMEYPLMEDFVDAWVKDDKLALEAYRAKCLAVKNRFPKL